MNTIKKLDEELVQRNVRRLIAESPYSNEELAHMLDISTRLIYHWQNGTRTPNINHIYGLAQVFKTTTDSILF